MAVPVGLLLLAGGGSTAMTGGPPGLTGGFHCPTLGPVRA